MIRITTKELKQLKDGEISQKDFAEKLAKEYSAYAIAEAFAELIATSDSVFKLPKIPITKEMFEAHFRLIGYNADGTESTVGRPKRKRIDSKD